MEISSILNISVYEMAILDKLIKVACEAIRAAEIIKNTYSNAFGIGKTKVHVYHTESFGEYYGDAELSIEGIWRYSDNWGGGNNWQVSITPEGIYKCLRAAVLKKHEMEDQLTQEERHLADVAYYFRDFVEKTTSKT